MFTSGQCSVFAGNLQNPRIEHNIRYAKNIEKKNKTTSFFAAFNTFISDVLVIVFSAYHFH